MSKASLRVLISPAHYYFTDNPQVSEPKYAYNIVIQLAKHISHLDVIVGSADLSRPLPSNINLIPIYNSRSHSSAIELFKYLMFYPLICLRYLSLHRSYDIIHHLFPTSPHTFDPLLLLVKLTNPSAKIIIGPLQLLSNLSNPQDLSLMLIGKNSQSFFVPLLTKLFNLLVAAVKPLAKLSFTVADVIVCPYGLIKKYYQKQFSQKIAVIPFGVDKVSPSRLHPPTKIVTVVCVGWLMHHKGQKFLLEAFKSLTDKFPDVRLVLIGEGDLEAEHRRYVETHHLESKVVFTGRVSYSEVEKWYFQSDIYCLPSLIDTNPVVVMEAMSHGLPVIATDVGAVPEIIGPSGIIVSKADSHQIDQALYRLCQNPKLRLKMGRLGQSRIKTYYTWSSIGRQWLNLYDNLAANHPI